MTDTQQEIASVDTRATTSVVVNMRDTGNKEINAFMQAHPGAHEIDNDGFFLCMGTNLIEEWYVECPWTLKERMDMILRLLAKDVSDFPDSVVKRYFSHEYFSSLRYAIELVKQNCDVVKTIISLLHKEDFDAIGWRFMDPWNPSTIAVVEERGRQNELERNVSFIDSLRKFKRGIEKGSVSDPTLIVLIRAVAFETTDKEKRGRLHDYANRICAEWCQELPYELHLDYESWRRPDDWWRTNSFHNSPFMSFVHEYQDSILTLIKPFIRRHISQETFDAMSWTRHDMFGSVQLDLKEYFSYYMKGSSTLFLRLRDLPKDKQQEELAKLYVSVHPSKSTVARSMAKKAVDVLQHVEALPQECDSQ